MRRKRMTTTLLLTGSVFLAAAAGAQDPNGFFPNLGCHSALSDGSGKPEEAYTHAGNVPGLDFVALSEHNDLAPLAEDQNLYRGPSSLAVITSANRLTQDGLFVALYGQEFSSISNGNHKNVFNVVEVIAVENGRFDLFLQSWLPANHDSTGEQALLLLKHSATRSSSNDREYEIADFGWAAEWREALDARAQLINMIKGLSHTDGTNLRPGRPSESEYRQNLNLALHLAATAGHDNPKRNWGTAADAITAVITPELTKPPLPSAMRAPHVYATEHRNLRTIGRVNGHLLSHRLSGGDVPAAGAEPQITHDIQDHDEPNPFYGIEVHQAAIGGEEADVLARLADAPAGTVTVPGVHYGGGGEYVFVRITQHLHDEEGRACVWTTPTSLEPDTATPPPPSGTSAVPLSVDIVLEEARVSNIGHTVLDIARCDLVSTRGNHFTFPWDSPWLRERRWW